MRLNRTVLVEPEISMVPSGRKVEFIWGFQKSIGKVCEDPFPQRVFTEYGGFRV
jgi:hypothetical protein